MIIVILVLFIVPGVIATTIYSKFEQDEVKFKSLFVRWLIFSFIIYTIAFMLIYSSSMDDGLIVKISNLSKTLFIATSDGDDMRVLLGEATSVLSEGIVFIFALIRRWCISTLVSSVLLPLLFVVGKMFINKKILEIEKE